MQYLSLKGVVLHLRFPIKREGFRNMSTKTKVYIFIFSVFITHTVLAQSNLNVQLRLNFPLFDLPYQIDGTNTTGNFFAGYSTLSMNQALSLTADVYSSFHFGMRKLYDSLPLAPMWNNIIFYGGTAVGLLAFGYVLPFGYPWLQQEYTRSILTRFNINSLNGRYNIFDPTGVTGVTDADLARLKAESPHNFVRMEEANIEGYLSLSDRMLRNRFLYDLHDLSNITAFLSITVGLGHVAIAMIDEHSFEDADNTINNWYQNNGSQKDRILLGFSGINWVYDLFRPGEPYAARGLHPSGDGSVARYITLDQLSENEREYLIKQGWLSLLNYVSPMLYGFNSFPFGKTGFEWNIALRHYLTSFGTDIPVQILLKKSPFNMIFTYHSYTNYEHYFPAIEAELIDFPVRFTPNFGLLISPRLLLGMQPRDQIFMTGEPEFLGLLGCRVDFAVSKHFFPYFDLSIKTDGWIAGNEYLERNASVKAGLSMRF
jgi:hypothetical protein